MLQGKMLLLVKATVRTIYHLDFFPRCPSLCSFEANSINTAEYAFKSGQLHRNITKAFKYALNSAFYIIRFQIAYFEIFW